MKQLKLNITGEINIRLHDEILNKVMSQNDFEEIVLVINSTGGSVKIAMAIYDLLKSLNTKIKTIAIGKCYSMATILFSLGEERYIGENSDYMLHRVNFTFAKDTTLTAGELTEMLKSSEADEKKWKEMISAGCDKDISVFLGEVFSSKEDVFLTPEETLDMGIATAKLKNLKDILSW